MESEAFISSENSCISTSRRTRAGWLARAGFYDFGSSSIATTALYSRQLAPGQANIPIVPARHRSRSGEFPNSGFRHSELGSGRERSELSSKIKNTN